MVQIERRIGGRFKKPNSLSRQKSTRESGAADKEAVEAVLPLLRSLLSQYSTCTVFNADEFTLLYKIPPQNTIGLFSQWQEVFQRTLLA